MKNRNLLKSKDVQRITKGAGKVAELGFNVTRKAGMIAVAGLAATAVTTSHTPEVTLGTSAPTYNQPRTALIAEINSIDAGGSAPVTSEQIALPGSIHIATGQPLVLEAGGHQDFAYTQGSEPDFINKSPKDLADSMTIVPNTGTEMATIPAKLNKIGTLETGVGSTHEVPVGFTVDGDNPGK